MRMPLLPVPLVRRLDPGHGFTRLGGLAWAGIATTIYATIGIVAARGGGLAPLALMVAGVFVALTALTYTELTGLRDAKGRRLAQPPGAGSFARAGFGEIAGFIASWAVVLDLVLLLAIAAEAAGEYALVLVPASDLDDNVVAPAIGIAVMVAVAARNARGSRLTRGAGVRVLMTLDAVVLAALALALAVTAIRDGLPLVPAQPQQLGTVDVLVASTLGLVALTGFETAASLRGGRGVAPERRKRFLIGLTAGTVAALTIAGLIAGTYRELLVPDAHAAPVAQLTAALSPAGLSDGVRVVVALLAVSTLIVAASGAMLAVTRIASALAVARQIPAGVGRMSGRHGTPVLIIAVVTIAAGAAVSALNLEQLVGLYAFGALLALTIVHAALLRLRWAAGSLERRWAVPGSIPVAGRHIPLPVVAAFLMAAGGWLIVVALHERAALLGGAWMAVGAALFAGTRRSAGIPMSEAVSVPGQVLVRSRDRGEFGSILVPVFGSALDDDIVQTAGRLARDRLIEAGAPGRGALIDVVWVVAMPMSLELGAPIGAAAEMRATAALERARGVGEDYAGVRVATSVVRARRIGEGIVDEARRRGVEAIVMAAEEPSQVRAGPQLGGSSPYGGRSLGPIAAHVVRNAPCRVILTAPARVDGPGPARDTAAS